MVLGMGSFGFGKLRFLATRVAVRGNTSTSGGLSSQGAGSQQPLPGNLQVCEGEQQCLVFAKQNPLITTRAQ